MSVSYPCKTHDYVAIKLLIGLKLSNYFHVSRVFEILGYSGPLIWLKSGDH